MENNPSQQKKYYKTKKTICLQGTYNTKKTLYDI